MSLDLGGYDVAVSYARSSRELASQIARDLASEYQVFLDQYETTQMWGAELLRELPQRYLNASICLILLTDDYMERLWPTLERDTIIEEVLREAGPDAVICVRLPGCSREIPSTLEGRIIAPESGHELAGILEVLRIRLGQTRR